MRPAPAREPCLDENTLASYAAGHLSRHAALAAERHIAQCDECRQVLSELALGENSDEIRATGD